MAIEFNSHEMEYGFLSNFYPCVVEYNGMRFKSAEAAFQSQKDPSRQEEFEHYSPSEAKYYGRKGELRPDWEQVKDQIMADVLMAKFSQNPKLKERLLKTGNEELVEKTWWHDTYWGICDCERCRCRGKNKLGELLMELRAYFNGGNWE